MQPQIGDRPASWPEALDLIAGVFAKTITEHGPGAVAFYVSGQFLTEDYYVANKLMKGFIGAANIDTNSRLCMASTVAGHVRAFGEDVVPGCYEDIDHADLAVLVGSNMAWCLPRSAPGWDLRRRREARGCRDSGAQPLVRPLRAHGTRHDSHLARGQPLGLGHRQGQCHHQLPSRDRPHRPARHGPVLAHRSA